jgi:putative copper export protein
VRAFAEWLYGTAPSVAIHSTIWGVRSLQAIHLLTAGVAAGSGVMIALKALGLLRHDEPFEAVWRRFAPWLLVSSAVMLATGLAQTLGDPVRELTATSYWVKLTLLAGCAAGTLEFAAAARRAAPHAPLPARTKALAAVLVAAWLAIAALGRMIGYDLAIWGSWSLRT